uniref:Cytochrome P450, putative n=1 Tax=Ixodes scapularis TaxID=6945 RepID=A0A1S4L1H1_IXOSC
MNYFKNICLKIIENRKENKSRQEDFLQLMMDAQDGKVTATVENASSTDEKLFNLDSEIKTDTSFAAGVKDEHQLARSTFIFLDKIYNANHNSGLHVLLLILFIATEVMCYFTEIISVRSIDLHHPSLDAVSKLKYLHGVVSESLRMFPPGARLERTASNDYVLGDTGIKVPKGCVIAVPVYAMHHEPDYFPDPATFDPSRFSDENIDSIRPYTYLPFGAGPRNCLGMRFALEAVKLSLLHSVHSVQFVRTENTQVPLEFVAGFGSLNAKHITLGIRKRTA